MQHECIPQAILGMDILCQAKSGMGKTAVFVLATLQQIEPVDGQVSFLFGLTTNYVIMLWTKQYICNMGLILQLLWKVGLGNWDFNVS